MRSARSRVVPLGLVVASAVAAAFGCGGGFDVGSPDGGPDAAARDGSAADGALSDGTAPGDGGATDGHLPDVLFAHDGPAPPPDGDLSDVTMTVSGTVVDELLSPIAGALVHIGGVEATTASDGTFTISAVHEPYDAFVVPSTGSGHLYQFVNLSAGQVTLQLPFELVGTARSSNVTVETPSSTGDGVQGAVFVDVTDATQLGVNAFGLNGQEITMGLITWVGSPTPNVTVYGLGWTTNDAGLPTSYPYYASKLTHLADGIPSDVTLMNATGVAAGPLPLTTHLPASGTKFTTTVAASWLFARPPGASLAAGVAVATSPVITQQSTLTTFEAPNIPGGTLVACGEAVGTVTGATVGGTSPFSVACQTGLGVTSQPSVVDPAVPVVTTPVGPVGSGPSYDFTWVPAPMSVSLVAFEPVVAGDAGSVDPSIFVITAETNTSGQGTAHLPEAPPTSFPAIPSDQLYQAAVYTFAPYSSVNAVVTPAKDGTCFWSLAADLARGDGPHDDGALSYGGAVSFTTK